MSSAQKTEPRTFKTSLTFETKISNAAQCNKSTSGTTHLNDRVKQCKYNAKISPKVTAYFSKSDISLSKVIKDTVLNSSVAFVVSDVRPLSAMEGDGLIQFANAMTKVEVTHGLVDAKAILPSRITIKRSIEKSASSSTEKLIKEVNKVIKKYSLLVLQQIHEQI